MGIALSTNQNGIEQLKIVEMVSPWAFNYAKRLTERLTEETLMRGQKCRHKKLTPASHGQLFTLPIKKSDPKTFPLRG